MGRTQRLGFAAVAALIAVVALVVLGGRSDEETNRADTPPATAVSDATPAPQEADAAPSPSATPTPTPTPKPKPEIETLRFRDGEVVGGSTRLEFDKGETIRFAVASDVDEEIHVHGYDRYVDVPAGKTTRVSLEADITGIFEVEMHGAAVELAQLRVDP